MIVLLPLTFFRTIQCVCYIDRHGPYWSCSRPLNCNPPQESISITLLWLSGKKLFPLLLLQEKLADKSGVLRTFLPTNCGGGGCVPFPAFYYNLWFPKGGVILILLACSHTIKQTSVRLLDNSLARERAFLLQQQYKWCSLPSWTLLALWWAPDGVAGLGPAGCMVRSSWQSSRAGTLLDVWWGAPDRVAGLDQTPQEWMKHFVLGVSRKTAKINYIIIDSEEDVNLFTYNSFRLVRNQERLSLKVAKLF